MGWPFTIIYTLLIIGALYFTFIAMPEALNANDWPQIQGEVNSTELIQRKHTLKTGKAVNVYSAQINYQYAVGANTYTGHVFKWADHHSDQEIERLMTTQHPPGSGVTVYYNPSQPNTSTLQPGLGSKHILTGLFLLVSICVMAFALYRTARKRR